MPAREPAGVQVALAPDASTRGRRVGLILMVALPLAAFFANVATRAVVYHVTGCDPADRIKLGTTVGSFFVHEGALLTDEPFNYQVTAVDDCGNERPFCGTTDCP